MAKPDADPSPRPALPSLTGAAHLRGSLGLVTLAWLFLLAQELLLFFRPTPYGGPYVDQWDRYFFFALLYDLLAVLLVSLPSLLYWWARYRVPVARPVGRRWHTLQRVALLLVVALDQVDAEAMRFLSTHFSAGLVETYGKVQAWGGDMVSVFATDQGGPWLSFVILGASIAGFLWLSGRLLRRLAPIARPWPLAVAVAAPLLLTAAALVVFNLPAGRFRREKIQPELFTLYFEARRALGNPERPPHLAEIARRHAVEWRSESGDDEWVFPDSEYPLYKEPSQSSSIARETAPGGIPRSSPGRQGATFDRPAPSDAAPTRGDVATWRRGDVPPNFIYLQLETFRGWDVGLLRPDRVISPTPFLDSLARAPGNAWWTRNLSFGPPTISGFMGGHCSIRPHATKHISTSFTLTHLLCFPQVLRANGYTAAYFTGSDPDWDNQTVWLRRWYDEHDYYADADELDRTVFHEAANRIRQLGRGAQPFLATIVSISNHYPFRSREAALDLTQDRAPTAAISNTMHYTDDVVREFVDGIRGEPWFARTIIVVVGDHGYNLGEHDKAGGHDGGWRENVWVPLIIAGGAPRLRPGRHDEVSTLLDVAPTIADLAGIRQPNPWLGRSLLLPPGPGQVATLDRQAVTYAESDRYAVAVDVDGTARLFDALADPLQQHDLAAEHPDVVRSLLARAREEQGLSDYLIESDRVWPAADSATGRPGRGASDTSSAGGGGSR